MKKFLFDFFSDLEKRNLLALRTWKDKVLSALVEFLVKIGIEPLLLSIIGFLVCCIFLLFVRSNEFLAFLILLFGLLFDMLDGAVARRARKVTTFGEKVDVYFDNAVFFIVLTGFLYANFLSFQIGFFYGVSYFFLLMCLFLLAKKNGVKIFVLKSKIYFYCLWPLKMLGLNLMNEFALFFGIYNFVMVGLILFSFKNNE